MNPASIERYRRDNENLQQNKSSPKSIKSLTSLKEELYRKGIELSEEEEAEIAQVTKKYPLRISSHYLSLIKERGDPIWNQCIPSIKELTDQRGEEDPLNEENEVPFLTHRYPDRCLLLVSNSCAMYCRFCTRKRKVGEETRNPTEKDLKKAMGYISEHKEIRDVILSGGDPLLLSNKNLETILKDLREISHIEMIRIGTRVPCTMPERVTPELCDMLKQYNKSPPIYINTHFEHPCEITPESKVACEMLADAGIPLGNQSVILKGVNDSPKIFKELNQKLLSMKVKPYYIYQPDPVRGTYHFIGSVEKGLDIIRALRGHTSGLAVPHFVIDSPGGGGKIPILPQYAQIQEDGSVSMVNYKGNKYKYRIEPK